MPTKFSSPTTSSTRCPITCGRRQSLPGASPGRRLLPEDGDAEAFDARILERPLDRDRSNRLETSGQVMAHVKLRTVEDVEEIALRDRVEQAIAMSTGSADPHATR